MDVNNQGNNEQQGNNNLNLGNPEDFLKNMNGSNGEAPGNEVQIPEKVGEFPGDKYFGAMESISGGKVKGYADFQNVLSIADKYTELEKKYQELEVTAKTSPFASDLSKGINEMLKRGATIDEVNHFVSLQKLDVATISDANAIKQAKKLQLTGISDEDVEDWFKETYGEEDDMTGAQKLRMKEDAKNAKDAIQKIKVDAGEPPAVRQAKAKQEEFNTRLGFWGNVMQKTVGLQDKHKLEIPLGKDKDGKEQSFSYDFPIPEESRRLIAMESAKYAASNGLGNTEEHFKAVQQIAKTMLWAKHGEEIVKNAVRHAKAVATETVLQQQHNVQPIVTGKGDPIANPIVNTGLEAELRKLAIARSKA